jgi:hypothetical protein
VPRDLERRRRARAQRLGQGQAEHRPGARGRERDAATAVEEATGQALRDALELEPALEAGHAEAATLVHEERAQGGGAEGVLLELEPDFVEHYGASGWCSGA